MLSNHERLFSLEAQSPTDFHGYVLDALVTEMSGVQDVDGNASLLSKIPSISRKAQKGKTNQVGKKLNRLKRQKGVPLPKAICDKFENFFDRDFGHVDYL